MEGGDIVGKNRNKLAGDEGFINIENQLFERNQS